MKTYKIRSVVFEKKIFKAVFFLLEPIILKESERRPNKDHSSKFMLELAQLSKRGSRKNVNINGS